MTKYFCDRCKFEVDPKSGDAHQCTPGIVGDKLLCKMCWERWAETVHRFFQQQGQ